MGVSNIITTIAKTPIPKNNNLKSVCPVFKVLTTVWVKKAIEKIPRLNKIWLIIKKMRNISNLINVRYEKKNYNRNSSKTS